MYYTYIIRCTNGHFYTGITTNLLRRITEHRTRGKESAKYTRANPAVRVEAAWKSESRSLASKLEAFIKSLSRDEKCILIQNPTLLKDKYGDKIAFELYQYDAMEMENVNNAIK